MLGDISYISYSKNPRVNKDIMMLMMMSRPKDPNFKFLPVTKLFYVL